MTIVSFFYYLISAVLLAVLGWTFLKCGRKDREQAILCLLVMVPLLLRLLRFN